MKKIRFIYNPVSGHGIIKTKIDAIIEKFQRHGLQVVPHKLLGKNDIKKVFEDFDQSEYHAVVAAGGDGTVHDVVNAMKSKGIDLPLGIIPAGTSNDFAKFLGLPQDINKSIDVIAVKENNEYVDIGRVNNKYFINVVAGGILSSIAHKAQKSLKKALGMFAYYFKALEEIPNIKPFDIEIISGDMTVSESVLMYLVLNTSVAGGFKVAPSALVDDGKFDVFLIKNCTIPDFGALFLKLLRNEHIQDDKVIYFQSSKLRINCNVDGPGAKIENDIDGEKGHEFPLEIETLPKSLRVFK